VWFLMTECNLDIIGRAQAMAYFKWVHP